MSEIDTNSEEFKAALREALDAEAAGLKSALKKERDRAKELEGKFRDFEGLDPAEIRKLMDERKAAADEKAKAAGDFEKLLNQEREKFGKELKARDERMTTLQRSLEDALIVGEAAKAIAKFEGDAELLLPHVKGSVKLLEVNGKHKAVVLDESGEPRLAPDAKTATDYMGIEHLVGSWKEAGKFSGAFAGTGASGGGAPARTREGGAGTRKKITLADAANMSSDEIRKGGFEVVA